MIIRFDRNRLVTDGQTDSHSIYRATVASRDNNCLRHTHTKSRSWQICQAKLLIIHRNL